MIDMRQRKLTFALLALLLILTGCKSESPTAPPPIGPGGTPGGGVTPPTNPTITLTGSNNTIKITSGGAATATLTAPAPGAATVIAAVGSATKSIDITFSIQPTTPPPSGTIPTITAVAPATGPPAGGTQVTITGTNFRTPVRVLFDIGDGNPKEAFVASSTTTQIVVITPPINLATTQTKATDII